ncbi:hypothetical protein [Salmonella enterica]|nr:hypothetical protein [Salmonella enterica]
MSIMILAMSSTTQENK